VDLAVMLADGGEAIADLAVLRNQADLFGRVASDPTAWRLLSDLDGAALSRLREARAQASSRAWAQAAETDTGLPGSTAAGVTVPGLVLDLDASLVICHSEKESATPTYKKTFGYHPLFCFLDGTREALSGLLREGRAGSNTTADHITVLDVGAEICEITGLVGADGYPEGTRFIVRRERPHPGAQLSLFDTIEGLRHQVMATDTAPGHGSIQYLEARHRAHARVEDRIRTGKDSGFGRFPSRVFAINQAWLELALVGIDLLAWTQTLLLNGELALAEPKKLRYRLLHVAARLTRSARRTRLRIAETWPWATDLAAAFTRLAALPRPSI
jgi:hypothetical protein